jgi:glycosyltransferase involved in cell wall biosynthesis
VGPHRSRLARDPDVAPRREARGRQPSHGRVCVVIPAHNESRVISALVRSLRAETYPDMRAVLALDRCTDDTAALARAQIADDRRFEIVEIDACPPGVGRQRSTRSTPG